MYSDSSLKLIEETVDKKLKDKDDKDDNKDNKDDKDNKDNKITIIEEKTEINLIYSNIYNLIINNHEENSILMI